MFEDKDKKILELERRLFEYKLMVAQFEEQNTFLKQKLERCEQRYENLVNLGIGKLIGLVENDNQRKVKVRK
jgi:hypothetical protein